MANKPSKLGSVWTSNAKLYNGQTLIGYCLDTPNAIAKAMMEQAEITLAKSPSLSESYTRSDMADRMKTWNEANSNFQKA